MDIFTSKLRTFMLQGENPEPGLRRKSNRKLGGSPGPQKGAFRKWVGQENVLKT